jgi:uncharacterized damage-inducible protein DinB
MIGKEGLGRLFAYTEWANHRVMRVAATLSVDDFKRDLQSSHGGVRGTLTHMLFAEWLWLERWKGLSPNSKLDEGEFSDVTALSERWRVLNDHRQSWFRGLPEGASAETIHYRNLSGRPFEAPLWQLAQHVVNHATYHRGQVVAMVRQLGARAVATDLVAFDREKPEQASGLSYAQLSP